MKPYFCILKVSLREPILDADGTSRGKPLVGYYQRVGISAKNETDARRLFGQIVTDGDIDWNLSTFLPFEGLEKEIQKCFIACKENDRWYMSGRIFFPKEDSM